MLLQQHCFPAASEPPRYPETHDNELLEIPGAESEAQRHAWNPGRAEDVLCEDSRSERAPLTTWSSGLVQRLPRTADCVALNNTRLLRSAFVLWQRLRGSILKPAYILATVLPRGIVGQPYPWMGKEHPAPSQVFTAFAFLVIGPTRDSGP